MTARDYCDDLLHEMYRTGLYTGRGWWWYVLPGIVREIECMRSIPISHMQANLFTERL